MTTDANRLRLLETLLHEPARSRADLGRALGLSRATVRAMLGELEKAGLVEQLAAEERATTMGRPPLHVSLAPGAAYAVGLDIGPRHVRAAVCDLVGTVLADRREEVSGEPGAALDTAERLVRAALGDIDPSRILGAGVGLAAPLDSTGRVQAIGVLPGWAGIEPAAELKARLGMPVRVTNDANAGALGEHLFGAGRGARDLIYLRLATGVGVGLILAGRPYEGFSGVAGEIGHTTAVEHGPLCRCGNRGCLEAVASSDAVTQLLSRGRGEPVSLAQLLELARGGDRGARRCLADAGEAVGVAVASAVNLLNPQLVIIGGELAAAGEPLLDPVRRAVERLAIAPAGGVVRVVPSGLGERAEVVGAAALQLAGAPLALASRLA